MKTLLLCVAIVAGAVFGQKFDENEVEINLKRLLKAVEADFSPPKVRKPLEVRELQKEKSSIDAVDEFNMEVRALADSMGSDR